MIDLSRHRRLLKVLYYLKRVKGVFAWRKTPDQEAQIKLWGDFYRGMWHEAAARLGASVQPLGYGILEIRKGAIRTRVTDNHCPLNDPITLLIAGNKTLVYQLLAREGLPIARHLLFTIGDMAKAVTFLEKTGGECVVKPANGTAGGQGITTGVRSSSQLARAALGAALHGGEILVEEQVAGANFRLLYLDGVLLDAVERNPPTVRGDGHTTIRQLVEAANADRLARGSILPPVLITMDQDMKNTLAREGLSLSSVPAKGTVVPLKTVINQGLGNDNIRASQRVCASIIADGRRAAQVTGARLAGVDVITANPGISLAEAGGVILEVNASPGYHHHYTRDGNFCLADHVLRKLLGELEPQISYPSQPEAHAKAALACASGWDSKP